MVPDGLPLTLHAYRLLTGAATPLVPALISHRLKRGKEHPARLGERYGESKIARPAGPMVWVHGASVGELLAAIPLIERIREKEFGVLCTSGTVTSANLAEQRLPKGVIHQFVTVDTPRYVRLRPRTNLAAILDERGDQALPDKVNGLISKVTVEILNLRPNMLVNVEAVK